MEKKITAVLLKHFPGARAVWLFGSFGTEYERRDSDVDIGLLLPERAGILEAVKESGRVLQ
ncbi:MAG: nucleotidyltransferase domain-containing protein [Aminivibrio sp.]